MGTQNPPTDLVSSQQSAPSTSSASWMKKFNSLTKSLKFSTKSASRTTVAPSTSRYDDLVSQFKAHLKKDEIVHSLWGVSLSCESNDSRVDSVILKFLEMKRFSVESSYALLKRVLEWRVRYRIDSLYSEDFREFEKMFGDCIFVNGCDKENRPILYVRYHCVSDLYGVRRLLADKVGRERFVRWRVYQFERAIGQLDFVSSSEILEICDLSSLEKIGIDLCYKEYYRLIDAYYPCLVGKKVFITSSPWFDRFLVTMGRPLLAPYDKDRKRVIFTNRKKCFSIMFNLMDLRYMLKDYVPAQMREAINSSGEKQGFILKKGVCHEICVGNIPAGETVKWKIAVNGWDVKYRADFLPNGEMFTLTLADQYIDPHTFRCVTGEFVWERAGELRIILDNSDSSKSKELIYERWFEVVQL